MLMQVLIIYFLWLAVLQHTDQIGGYSRPELLTYIVGTAILRAVVFSSQSQNVQRDIGSGELNNHLVKPVNYFSYWFTRDIADKVLNLLFSVVEIGLIYLILRPPLVGPETVGALVGFILAAGLAMVLYFFFSLIISLSVFWMPEGNGWPQRFFVFVMLEFLSGGVIPLDMLPEPLYQVLINLPTAYMLNVPLQIYLGRMEGQVVLQALGVMVLWIGIFYLAAKKMFNRGVKVYGAYGG